MILNRKYFYVFIALVILFSFSCKTAAKKGGKGSKNYYKAALTYMPLEIGNSWKYKVNYMGQQGDMEVTIKSKNEKGFFVDNRGGLLKVDERGIRDEERYLLFFPLSEKKDWIAITKPARKKTKKLVINTPTGRETKKIVDLDRKVVVPAGTFEGAIVVQSEKQVKEQVFHHTYHFFARDVGIVKIETYIWDQKNNKVLKQTLTELSSYKIK